MATFRVKQRLLAHDTGELIYEVEMDGEVVSAHRFLAAALEDAATHMIGGDRLIVDITLAEEESA
jgi:hypothetical protein